MKTKIETTKKELRKWNPDYIKIAKNILADGHTEKKVYDYLGIAEPTGIRWKKEIPEFGKVFEENTADRNKHVEDSLYNSAIGHWKIKKKLTPIYDKKTGAPTKKMKVSERYEDWVEGSIQAQIFWLSNRAPERWKLVKDIIFNNTINNNISLKSPEERHKELLSIYTEDQIKDLYNQYQRKQETELAIDVEANSIDEKDIEENDL